MASAYAAKYGALGRIKERKMKGRMASNIAGDAFTAAMFIDSKLGKAKTAREEFEAGYEEMGGDVSKLEKPGILKQIGRTLMPGGHKGFFQMPEGEYTIGKDIYQAENLRTVGEYAKQLKDPTSEVSEQMILQGIDREEMMGRIKQFAPGSNIQRKGIEPPFQETEAGGYGVDPNPRGRGFGQWLGDFSQKLGSFNLNRGPQDPFNLNRGPSAPGTTLNLNRGQRFAAGGRIPGKDTGDDNLVRAEDDEYILNREAADGLEREHGKGFLDYVNFEKYPRFQTGGRKRSPGYQEGGEVGQANGLATKEEIDRYFQETEGMANIGDPYLVRGEARDLMMERNKTIGSIFTGSTETKNLRSGLEQYTDFQEQIEPGTGTAEDFSGYEEYISHNPETGRFFTERSSWEPRKQALWEQYVNSTMMDPVTVKGRRKYQEGGSVESPYRNNVMDLYNRYGGRK